MIPRTTWALACLVGAACAGSPPAMVALEARVANLELMLAQREEALAFLDKAYDQQIEAQTRPKPGTIYGVDIAPNVALGQVAGAPDALVTIVKVWDFACPHCHRASALLEEILDEYAGKVRVVFKHLVVHPQQVAVAHLAACAAARQGKFMAFYKAFWEQGYEASRSQRDPSLLGEDNVYRIADAVGLDVDRLKADLPPCQEIVRADQEELRKFKVSGTPAFFINGEFVGGGIPKDALAQHVDRKLEIAERSGVPGAVYYAQEIRAKGEQSVKRPAGRGAGGGPPTSR